jgi:hypothetical protein
MRTRKSAPRQSYAANREPYQLPLPLSLLLLPLLLLLPPLMSASLPPGWSIDYVVRSPSMSFAFV